MSKRKRKRCAVCGTTIQTNIIFKWQRFKDGKVFNVCAMCAEESGKVNEHSVDNFGSYSGAECVDYVPEPKHISRTLASRLKLSNKLSLSPLKRGE